MYSYCMTPKVERQENAFAQYGTLAHELIEAWAAEKLLPLDLASEWERRYYSVVTEPFPYASSSGYDTRYYEAGKNYFNTFTGFGDGWKVLSVEEEFFSNIGGFLFRGFADLLLRHESSGELMLVDHKSTSASSIKKSAEKHTKQVYLYAGMVQEKYGKYPSILQINYFKAGQMKPIPFCKADYLATVDWATSTASEIAFALEFPRKEDYYFCNNLCSVRNFCTQKKHQEQIEAGLISPFGLDI